LLINNQITHHIHRKERALQHVKRALHTERVERERRVGIQLTDGQFALLTELENLRQVMCRSVPRSRQLFRLSVDCFAS
jgi:hypothetical protein